VEPAFDPVQPGVVLDERYRVERTLGSGAMGIVVLARHLELDQTVAIKLLRPELAGYPGVAMRFRDEARATASIRSQHAVRVYDVSPASVSPPFIVMERLRGSDLEAILQQGRLEVAEAVDYVLQACAGVAAAHALGIIHRDLKPANLFLAAREGGGHVVKVLDFGIAKSILEESKIHRMTASGEMKGTPAYMSPDQLESPGDLDVTTDVWALGTILCELVTGQLPFQAATMPRLCAMILTDPPARPSNLRPGLSPAFDAVVLKCLEKNRAARYQSVGELAEALAPLATHDAKERVANVHAALLRTDGSTAPPPDEPRPPILLQETLDSALPLRVAPAEEPMPKRSSARAIALAAAIAVALVAGVAAAVAVAHSRAPAGLPATSAAAPGPSAPVAPTAPVFLAPPPSVASSDVADTPEAPSAMSSSAPSARPSRAPPSRSSPATGGRPPSSQDDREFGGRK
jgi:serine/threonine protein kinase